MRVDAELAHHAIDEHFEVELAHTRDDRLPGLVVGVDLEGRVFVRQRAQGLAQLVLVVLRLRLDRDRDHGLGEDHALEHDRVLALAERVARGGLLETEAGDDVARVRDLDVEAVVRVHAQDAADALLAVLGGVVDLGALLELARVDAEVGELAVGVGDDLERERREGRALFVLADDLVFGLRVDARGRRDVERRREEVDDRVEHGLDALVLERGAAQHGHELALDGSGAQRTAQLVGGDRLVGEVLLHHGVVGVHHGLEQLVTPLLGELRELARDVEHLELRAFGVVAERPDLRVHLDEVDHAAELALGADRKLHHGGRCREAVLHHVDATEEVGADAVHLVDETDARHVVLVGLAPHRLGLRLHAGDRVEHRDRAVEDTQRALDLDREVDVAGRVDDVDLAVAPFAGGRGRRDRDAALLLLDHVVHHRGAFVHLADLVGATGVEEDALGRRGLARVDVGHDADVAGLFEGELAGHVDSLLLKFCEQRSAGREARPAGCGLMSARRGRFCYRLACSCITARILIGLVSGW